RRRPSTWRCRSPMTSCRTRANRPAPLLRGAALSGLLLCFAAAPVFAQSSSSGTVIQTLPLPAPAAPGGGQGGSAAGGGSAIEVGTLGDVTPDYAGTLEEGGGGFPSDMWKGTDRALVEHLLPQLPAALGSPAMRDLERRLLLTNAGSP